MCLGTTASRLFCLSAGRGKKETAGTLSTIGAVVFATSRAHRPPIFRPPRGRPMLASMGAETNLAAVATDGSAGAALTVEWAASFASQRARSSSRSM